METTGFEPEEWMLRLKEACEAGRYRTEVAAGEQERFPWQDKTCGDCPFWLDTAWCEVHAENREHAIHTCTYFDDPYREAARNLIEQRLRESRRRFWDWISGGSSD